MNVQGLDHVEFWVADAGREATRLCSRYGFRVTGELTAADHRSVLTVSGGNGDGVRIVLTEGIAPEHPAAEYVRAHGDGVAVIALATPDPAAALAEALDGGAQRLTPDLGDGPDRARIRAFGDVAHTFVRPGGLAARFGRPAEPARPSQRDEPLMFDAIDHVAVCVRPGELGSTVRFYQDVLGFQQVFEEYIEVGEQAMDSKVVQSQCGGVTLTVIEPDTSRVRGQIDDFIDAHGGSGVQHLALRTEDIATTVRALSGRGVRFLNTPGSYYDELERRLGPVGVPVDVLRELSVLVDRDNAGELFQIFAQSTHPRRTYFFEVIERRDALTFGSANIKALYQAVERERAKASPGAGVSA